MDLAHTPLRFLDGIVLIALIKSENRQINVGNLFKKSVNSQKWNEF